MLDPNTISSDPKFIDMHNIVHIDEKWFFMTKKNKKYYLLPEEDDTHRTVQNKNSIGKVMFLAMVAMPRHDEHGNETFSGKLGVFPFVTEVILSTAVYFLLCAALNLIISHYFNRNQQQGVVLTDQEEP